MLLIMIKKVRKVIRALLPSWEIKYITLKEINDKKEMELITLVCNLKTHEMERKAKEEMAPQKKKMIAFKSTPTISDNDDEEENDEEFSLLVKNVRRMLLAQRPSTLVLMMTHSCSYVY